MSGESEKKEPRLQFPAQLVSVYCKIKVSVAVQCKTMNY